MSLLSVRNLSLSFHTHAGIVRAVRDISFDLEEGGTLAIVGESGCGKSVTSKAIMGMYAPSAEIHDGSHIFYQGADILTFSEKELRHYRGRECSIVFQDALAALNPTMRIGNQIAEKLKVHARLSKDAARKESIRLLKLVGIPDAENRIKQYPHEFSGGMRQRVMIAIAVADHPKILIADEPTTALDVTIQSDILELLKSLRKKMKMSLILVTHDLGIVANIAEHTAVMYAGTIVEYGTTRDIFSVPRHPYTQALLHAVPRLDRNMDKPLTVIEGTPPSLLHPPAGCPFAMRCPHRMDICTETMPPAYTFEGSHYAKCRLYDKKVKGDGQYGR